MSGNENDRRMVVTLHFFLKFEAADAGKINIQQYTARQIWAPQLQVFINRAH